jgi:hypothetical protein
MRRFLFFTIIGFIAILFFSCNEETDNTPVISISPFSLHFTAKVNEFIPFIIKIQSPVALKSLKIHNKIEGTGAAYTLLLDSNLAGSKGFNYEYDYKVSLSYSGKTINFKFTVFDNDGNSWELIRYAEVQNNEVILTEIAGCAINSKYSGKPDGFDIESCTQQFSANVHDSLIDIMDYDTLANDSLLNKTLTSKTGAKFVAFNGFDYANATNVTASNAYDAGNKLDIITNLTIGDILITKTLKGQKSTIAVIRITTIVDLPGTSNDRYEFNVKK